MSVLREFDEARDGRFTLGYLGLALAMQGDRAGAQHTLMRMDAYAAERYVSPLDRALVYSGLGDLDRTFEYLRDARDQRVSDIVRLKLLPWPDELKADPRFAALAHSLKLPA
jgi:hypothetical protein